MNRSPNSSRTPSSGSSNSDDRLLQSPATLRKRAEARRKDERQMASPAPSSTLSTTSEDDDAKVVRSRTTWQKPRTVGRGGSEETTHNNTSDSQGGSNTINAARLRKPHDTPSGGDLGTSSSAPPAPGVPALYEVTHRPDPRHLIESMIIESGEMSVNVEDIEAQLRWADRYEEYYGTLQDYLLGYQSIFIVSPIADSVALRNQQLDVTTRRSTKPKKRQHLSHLIGSISYSSVAESFNVEDMKALYRNRGFRVKTFAGDVLHVSSPTHFDIFILSNGVVVWWGMDRLDHWMVDEDFMADSSVVCTKYTSERHWQKDIVDLFPIWCTYEYDKHSVDWSIQRNAVGEDALIRFNEKLCFDHYLIPADEPLRTQVMLAVSYSLARSAKVDYLEHVTQASQKAVLAVPSEPKTLWDHFSASKRVAQLEGELRITQMNIMSLHDSPEFLWDMPWLRGYFVLSENQNSVEPRRDWFLARSDALFQKLQSIQSRRHRLFMMSSDVFLIVLLVLDVVAMLCRLSWKMFFREE